jgi:hypothetical protein
MSFASGLDSRWKRAWRTQLPGGKERSRAAQLRVACQPRRDQVRPIALDGHALRRLAHQAFQERDIPGSVVSHVIAAFGMGATGSAKARAQLRRAD